MIVSDARREANRRNASLSTGPRTEEGKDRSRRNALVHGLAAEVVRLPEEDALARGGPSADREAIGPGKSWQAWLVDEVAVITSRLDRCDRLDRGYRERTVRRAEHCWEDDRRLDAEFLGSGLAGDPAGVSRSLRMTPQGCSWMIERWALLARAADRDLAWTPEQQALAFDLLGTPRPLRGGEVGESLDPDGRPIPSATGGDLAALARREVAGLLLRKAEVTPADALDRSIARQDVIEDADPDLRKLRRYEATLHRRLRWCIAEIEKGATLPHFAPEPHPITHETPNPPAPPETPRPAFPTEPDPTPEPVATPPAIQPGAATLPTPRRDPQLLRDQVRRASKNRKREDRRA